jgi:hypothetical protein
MARSYGAPFWTSVHFGESCYEWMGSIQGAGYGTKWHDGRVMLTHRIAWEERNGPIPKGMLLCHTCDNRRCVRLDHMFLGTDLDNSRDKWSKGRGRTGNMGVTHCKRGHEFTAENTYRQGDKRSCRICRKMLMDRWQEAQRDKDIG